MNKVNGPPELFGKIRKGGQFPPNPLAKTKQKYNIFQSKYIIYSTTRNQLYRYDNNLNLLEVQHSVSCCYPPDASEEVIAAVTSMVSMGIQVHTETFPVRRAMRFR